MDGSATATSAGQADSGPPAARVLVERIEQSSAILLTLNRAADRNPLDMSTLGELQQCLETANADPGVRAIVITGSDPAFSAGGDLKAYRHLYANPAEFRQFLDRFQQVCALLESCAAVTVAMVNGVCVAGGLELALACDLITMSESATISDGHLKFGQLPGAGGSQRLVRAIGLARSKNWLITGRHVSADEARQAGLVSLVAPRDELRDATLGLIAPCALTSPYAMRRMKQLVRAAARSTLEDGLVFERDIVFDYATTSEDSMEGLRAFGERRPPRYAGR